MENRASRLLQDFLTEISQVRRYSPETVRAYRADLARFAAFCGPVFEGKVEKIAKAELVGRFLAQGRRAGRSARTVARRASALRSFFKYLARQGWLAGDVSDIFPSIKLPRTIPRYLSKETMKSWLANLPDKTVWHARDRAMVLTFYASGARLAEIAGLKWQDIDFAQQQIMVLGKKSKQRVVPIGAVAASALYRYQELVRASFNVDMSIGRAPVFLNQRGTPLHRRSISRILQKHFPPLLGDSAVHPHLLRHTFATHLINAGADLMAIKELLGHESAGTTQIYSHVSGTKIKKEYNRAFPRAKGDSE